MMGGAYGGWHWLFSFHGFLSIVFGALIVFAVVALVRDLRRREDKPRRRARREPVARTAKPAATSIRRRNGI
jgi:uncharacterized membrane protein